MKLMTLNLCNIVGEGLPLGIIVTVKGNTNVIHFYSRFFAPGLGVAEDPVIMIRLRFKLILNI